MTRHAGPTVFAALLLLAAALHPGVVDNVDSRIILRTAERLLDHGTWSLGDVSGTYFASPEYGARGPDGSFQMKFGPGTALLDVPFVLLGRAVLGPLGLDVRRAGEAGAAAASVLWFAFSGLLVLRIARRVLSERAAVGAALLHCVASYALVYGRSAYLETPLTVAVLLAFDAALAARERPADPRPAVVLGLAVAAVVWIKLAAVLLLAGVAPVLFLGKDGFRRESFRALRTSAIVAALGVAGWMATNHARFGSPFATGYAASARFDNPILEGLRDLLFSKRGGLLFFAPCALLGIVGLPRLAKTDRGLAWGIGLALALALPLYATFFSPFGGDAWGPRYLLPNAALLAVPAAGLLAAWLAAGGARRAAAAATVSFGCALQTAPSVVSFTEVWTFLRATDVEGIAPGQVAARILVEKSSGRARYNLETILSYRSPYHTMGTWTPPAAQQGIDLWPVRVSRDLPQRTSAAWTAWAFVALGTAAASAVLLRRTRSAAT
jgi:hypothetical protein